MGHSTGGKQPVLKPSTLRRKWTKKIKGEHRLEENKALVWSLKCLATGILGYEQQVIMPTHGQDNYCSTVLRKAGVFHLTSSTLLKLKRIMLAVMWLTHPPWYICQHLRGL